jgi:hypothetical protein
MIDIVRSLISGEKIPRHVVDLGRAQRASISK